MARCVFFFVFFFGAVLLLCIIEDDLYDIMQCRAAAPACSLSNDPFVN